MTRKLSLAILALVTLTGCAARNHPSSLRASLNPSCLTAPIVLQDCDFSTEPLRCRVIKVTYRSGCEQLQVNASKSPVK
jgi:hypothetical protein